MFVLERIRAHAAAGRTALINRDERLSFGQLDRQSDAFAAHLIHTLGSDNHTPILIYGHKQTSILPCLFGALKAGHPYVPVDTTVPRDRLAIIVADVAPRLIVDFTGSLIAAGAAVLYPDTLSAILHSPPCCPVPESGWVTGEQTAYILFTSGSTGRPKGVPITAHNLTSFYGGLLPHLPIEEGGVILNQISYAFDVSCCALYAGLSRGMTLFTIDNQMTENMGLLFDCLSKSGLTIWVSTPSFAEMCIQSGTFTDARLPDLRQFLFCGEVLTHKLCDQLSARFGRADILNTYGPTEATVLVTAVRVTEAMRASSLPIPIGCPIAGTTLRIIDKNRHETTSDDTPGELLILGDSVGPGYLGRPDLTAERFFTDEQTGKRGYRTGDIAFYKGGLAYYSGRADNQLKLNGFRIEIEDIEHNLARLDGIARAAVVPVSEEGRVQYLVAFVLLEGAGGLSPIKRTIQLKKQAGEVLPAYMIPRRFIAVDAFPLGTSGKIDKKALAVGLGGDAP